MMLHICLSTRSKGEIAKDNFVQTDDVGIKITAFEDNEKKRKKKKKKNGIPTFDAVSIQDHIKKATDTLRLYDKCIQGQGVSETSYILSEGNGKSAAPKRPYDVHTFSTFFIT